MIENTLVIQKTLFLTIAKITFEPMSSIEKKTRQILLINISNLRFLNKKKQARKAILSKNIYQNIFKFLIHFLPEFL